MDLRFLIKLNLILVSLFCLRSKAESSHSVVFFDSPDQRYIRNNPLMMVGEMDNYCPYHRPCRKHHRLKKVILRAVRGLFGIVPHSHFCSRGTYMLANSLNVDEVAATISVLLGIAPSASLTADSSSKLNEVLFPNPFDQPRAVFVLEVGGLDRPFLSFDYSNSEVGSTFSSMVHGSAKAYVQLPDEDEVSVVPLDEHLGVECDAACADKELGDLAQWLGGSYVGTLKSLDGELKLPLASGTSLNLHINEKADRHFALSLASLVGSIKKAVEIHEDFPGRSVSPAELMMGRFTGIEALKEEYGPGDITSQGEQLFQIILMKSFELLQKAHRGKIVGVVLSTGEPNSNLGSMLEVKLSTRVSRLLEEVSPADLVIAEVLLVRRSLAWITAIILLVSTLMGVCFLVNMPLTRDTLLYSNVKLD